VTAPLGTATCAGCGSAVLVALDHLTEERVLIDPQRVAGGRVEIIRPPLGGGFVAIDHITRPAARQPAYELHTRTCTAPVPVPPVNLDDDPIRERSGGWRQ